MSRDPAMHFYTEHGDEPHCYACRKRIEVNELVVLLRISEDVVVWWHERCAPADSREYAP